MKAKEACKLICPFGMDVGKVCQTTLCMAWQKGKAVQEGHMGKTYVDNEEGRCLLIPKE